MLFIAGDDSHGQMLDLERRSVVRQYNVGLTHENSAVYCPNQKLVAVHQSQKCTSFLSRQTQQIVHRSFTPEMIYSCAVSACGSFMYAGTVTGQLMVWNLSTGELLRSSKVHVRAIGCLSAYSDDSLLVTASDDSMCKVWQTASLCCPYPPGDVSATTEFTGHTLAVTSCVFCHHSALVVSGSADRTCRLFDAMTGTSLHVLAIGDAVTALALNEQDSMLVVGTRSGRLCFVRLGSDLSNAGLQSTDQMLLLLHRTDMEMIRREPSPDGHHSALVFLAFSAHNHTSVFTVSANGKVLLYDALNGELRADCAPYRVGKIRSCCLIEDSEESAVAPASVRVGLHKNAVDPTEGEFHLMGSVCLQRPQSDAHAAARTQSPTLIVNKKNKDSAKKKSKSLRALTTPSAEEQLRRVLLSNDELIKMKAQLEKKLRKLQAR